MENKKVLFIDNDHFFRRLYKRKLEEKGVKFLEAEDGNRGWELIINQKPDLIITELIYPGKGGFKIMKDVKENSQLPDIPVIVFTNLAQESDKENAKELGAKAYFVKNKSNLKEVLKKIEEVLKK